MKKLFFITLSLFFATILSAKEFVVNNPVFEFTTSGIESVTKIEFRKNETRVHIRTDFVPGWWIKFEKTTFIEDSDSKERWYVTRMEKGELDEKIRMPASGDSAFVICFPPIDRKKVKKLNYGKGEETRVFGISLNPKEKPKSKEVPGEVYAWIDRELGKAKEKAPMNLDAGEFFRKDTVHIIGYINGYKPEAGFKTGIVYTANEITRENYPTVVEVYEDGRFECKFIMNHPKCMNIIINEKPVSVYLEPGHTIAVLLDWNEYLLADRYRNIRYNFKNIIYKGPLAKVNSELCEAYLKIREVDAATIHKSGFDQDPDSFAAYIESMTADYCADIEKILADDTLCPTTKVVLRNNMILEKWVWLLNYDMQKGRNQELPIEFYSFLREIPLTSPHLMLSSQFSVFVNRFEYCAPLFKANVVQTSAKVLHPEKSFEEYLFDELKLKKTPEETAHFEMYERLKTGVALSQYELDAFNKKNKEIIEKYSEQHKKYIEKYIKPLRSKVEYNQLNRQLTVLQLKDSIYTDVLKLEPGVVYDITKVRELASFFKGMMNREDSRVYLNKLSKSLKEPFLKSEAERIYNHYFPIGEKTAHELPVDMKGTNVFKQMIDPHKGKYVFVDFWSTSCGPCISGIKKMKETREKYKDHPDVAFVFITSERDTPLGKYNDFVAEQELINTYRISSDDFLYLRQLFKFNGIPRYVLVDREGKIADDNYSMYLFSTHIKELLKEPESPTN
ncbi:TlpA family protein disulfide reductase [Bacteroides sp. 214]|uniref:TlpA family protein disulfide reductase n=1 Tax=Bacteroides sp. 214 TaxID=2302935 RepID=UPI0013D7C448|nr:TlpA disulfide reductase family protein [Bacteroides sp. 214]NDW11856.1 TlpA family protein disulfide reductase [Bacteroides sp. 214]